MRSKFSKKQRRMLATMTPIKACRLIRRLLRSSFNKDTYYTVISMNRKNQRQTVCVGQVLLAAIKNNKNI